MTDLVVYWRTNNIEIIRQIRDRFGIYNYTTVNGESPASIRDEDMELLRETERRGYIQIRRKTWCRRGDFYLINS